MPRPNTINISFLCDGDTYGPVDYERDKKMTLSNDQIIQVAKKVWGFDSIYECLSVIAELGDLDRMTRLPVGSEQRNSLQAKCLSREIESWQGFGRTLEAMRKRKMELEIIRHSGGGRVFRFTQANGRIIHPGFVATIIGEIPATHLAALDALEKK